MTLLGLVLAQFLRLNSLRQVRATSVIRQVAVIIAVVGATYLLIGMIAGQSWVTGRKHFLAATLFSGLLLFLVRTRFPQLFQIGVIKRSMLILGAHMPSIRAIRRYQKDHAAELDIMGVVEFYKAGAAFEDIDWPKYTKRESIADLVKQTKADTIAVLSDQNEFSNEVIKLIEEKQIEEVFVRTKIPLIMANAIELQYMEDLPLLKVFSLQSLNAVSKTRNLIDRLGAAVGLLILSPLIALVAVVIKLSDKVRYFTANGV